jgi:hypothetical protein
MTQCCFVALREPHSVLLQFRGDAADEAALIDATVTRLSTHFEQARYFYNRDVPLRGAACVDELRDCVLCRSLLLLLLLLLLLAQSPVRRVMRGSRCWPSCWCTTL